MDIGEEMAPLVSTESGYERMGPPIPIPNAPPVPSGTGFEDGSPTLLIRPSVLTAPGASDPTYLLPTSVLDPSYLLPIASDPSYLQPIASDSSYLQPIASDSSYLQPLASDPSYLLPPIASDLLSIPSDFTISSDFMISSDFTISSEPSYLLPISLSPSHLLPDPSYLLPDPSPSHPLPVSASLVSEHYRDHQLPVGLSDAIGKTAASRSPPMSSNMCCSGKALPHLPSRRVFDGGLFSESQGTEHPIQLSPFGTPKANLSNFKKRDNISGKALPLPIPPCEVRQIENTRAGTAVYEVMDHFLSRHSQKKFSDVSEDDMSGDLSPALRHHRPGHPVVPPLEKMPSRVDSMDYLDHHDGSSTTRKNNTVYEMERRDDDRVFFVKDEGGSKEELLNRARQQRRCNYSLCLCLLIVSLVSLATLGVLVVNFTSPETFSQSLAKAQKENGTVSADEFSELKAELNRLKQQNALLSSNLSLLSESFSTLKTDSESTVTALRSDSLRISQLNQSIEGQNALLSSNLSQLTESFSTLKMDSESTVTALRSASMRISQLNQTIEGQEPRYDPSQCIFRSRSEEDDLRGHNSTSPLAPSPMDPEDHVITSVSCTSENVYAVQLMNINPPSHVYRCWCGEHRIESSSLKRICTINYLLCPSSSLALTAP